MKYLQVLVLLAILNIIYTGESQISMAKAFGCSMEGKIEVKDIISECECADKSTCVWTTGRRPVMGCPCPVKPPANTNYDSVITAEILGCSDKKIEINKNFGQCECAGGKGQCIFAGRKPIAGCPCPGGRMPVDSDFNEIKPVSHKKKKRRQQKNSENEDL